MDQQNLKVQSQITFLYYHDLGTASAFYEQVMGFEPIDDQGWARIYRVKGSSYLGIVDERKGFLRAKEENAVLITFVVDDVVEWYDYLHGKGVTMLTELQEKDDIQVRCFFFEDPGGYALEIQQFLRPDLVGTFHRGES